MSEVIGIGPLELGVLGINKYGSNFDKQYVRELIRKTLEFYPLGRIFHLDGKIIITDSDISIRTVEPYELSESVDQLVILSKMNMSKYDPENGFIYCEMNPIEIAHEIGHALGLQHPVKRCHEGICTLEYMKHICPYSRNIMGCAVNQTETIGFTSDDIKELESWLK